MMLKEKAINGSILLGALLLTSNVSGGYSNSSYRNIPVVCETRSIENNSAEAKYIMNFSNKNISVHNNATTPPKLNSMGKKAWYEEAADLFGEIRGLTEEESVMYSNLLEDISESMGVNYFDL